MNRVTSLVLSMVLLAATARKHYKFSKVEVKDNYQGEEYVSRCAKRLASAVDGSRIVNLHNKLRRKQGASDMKELTYSWKLAELASEKANECDYGNIKPPPDIPRFDWIHQNLYLSALPEANFTEAILSWYNEKSDYDYDTFSCAPNKVCSNYERMVWSTALKVGCGFAICPTLLGTSLENAAYIVCNYGAIGDPRDHVPFLKGPSCSKCPDKYNCNLRLCQIDHKYDLFEEC